MALKKLPGGVIVETDGGARLNEEAGVNLEAIHRQLGAQSAAALDALKTKADITALNGVRATAQAAQSTALDARATANAASSVAGSAQTAAGNAVDRVTALESAAGFGPSTPTDGQTASLVLQPDTQTRAAVDTAAELVTSMRVGPTRVDIASQARTADRAGVQAVIDAHGPGAEFYFSAAFPGRELVLDGAPLTPSAPGQRFVHDRAVTTRQPVLYAPVYDVLDRDDVTIHDLTAVGPDARPASGTAWRGSSTANYQAAIWTNSQRTRVTGRTQVTNFKIGVNFSPYNSASQAWETKSRRGHIVEDLDVTGSDFGVLACGVSGLRLDKVTTRDHIDSSKGRDPNHAVYVVGKSGTVRNEDVQIGQIICTGLTYGQVLQVKETDGLTVGAILASQCATVLNLQDVWDWSIGQIVHRDTVAPTSAGPMPLVWTQTPVGARGHIGSIVLDDTGDAAAGTSVMRLYTDDLTVGSAHITTHRAANSSAGDVVLTGRRPTLGHLATVCAGAASTSLVVGHSSASASDAVIRSHASQGASQVVNFTSNSTGTSYTYSPSQHRGGTYTGDGLTRTGTVTIEGWAGEPVVPVTKTANATLKASERLVISNGAAIIYLAAGSTAPPEGTTHTVKNIAASSVDVRVQGGSAIDGDAKITLAQWQTVRVMRTGGTWVTL